MGGGPHQTKSGLHGCFSTPSAAPCPSRWLASASLPGANSFSVLPPFPPFLFSPLSGLERLRKSHATGTWSLRDPGFSSLTWTLHRTISPLFPGLAAPPPQALSVSLLISFRLCSCLSLSGSPHIHCFLFLDLFSSSSSSSSFFFPGSIHLPSLLSLLFFPFILFLPLSLSLLPLPFFSPSSKPPPPNHLPPSRPLSGHVPWVRGAPGSPWSSLTAARPRQRLGGGMGPEIPCGEACPTPCGAGD